MLKSEEFNLVKTILKVKLRRIIKILYMYVFRRILFSVRRFKKIFIFVKDKITTITSMYILIMGSTSILNQTF